MLHSSPHERVKNARSQTDAVFEVLRQHAYSLRPVPERHRLIFYLGHVEAFDWNHIAIWASGERSFLPEFDRLFEAGIDPAGGDLPDDRPEDWPDIAEILSYRDRTRSTIDALLDHAPSSAVDVAIEHRLMHAETLSYLIHNLPFESKCAPSKLTAAEETTVLPDGMVEIPGGVATLGKPKGEGFGWDNEFDEHLVRVPAFAIDRHKVSNGTYLEFVRTNNVHPPHFWEHHNGEWFLRAMFGLVSLPLDWPVYVTQAEATAFARSKGKCLPTEAQFHRAAYGAPEGVEREFPWGNATPTHEHGNFNFVRWDPIPVNAAPAGDSAYGVAQLVGNGWEWTSTSFEPFPGFVPMPNYPGYSSNFFDGQHFVLKGGSARTASSLLRRSFRNWFRPQYPYVYASFRCTDC
jgi:iron(II)-dependent oxidoreductase